MWGGVNRKNLEHRDTHLTQDPRFAGATLPMDAPITKRLIISGLTTSITVDDISGRLATFGTVKATDGFGLTDGLGQPRKFGYVTLETTTGKLAKCMDKPSLLLISFLLVDFILSSTKGMNLLSGSTWKGAKLRFGEAKADFKERCVLPHCWLSFTIQNSYIYIYASQGLLWRTKQQLKGHRQKNEEGRMKVHKQKTCRWSLQQMWMTVGVGKCPLLDE